MTVEHRAARGLDDIELELVDDGEKPFFRLSQPPCRCGAAARHKTVASVVKKLVRQGRIRYDAERRYRLVASLFENTPPAANGSRPCAARFPVSAGDA